MRLLAKHPGLSLATVLLVAVAGAFGARACGARVRSTHASRRDLEQHVVASGRVWVPTRLSIATQVPGLVIAVGAVEGQRVRTGDLLLQIDDAELQAAAAQAKAAVDQATARVTQLRKVGAIVANEASRQAETNLQRAQADLARAEQLSASGALSRTELDDARRRLDIAQAQRSAAEAQQIAATPLGADSRVALSGLLQTQAQFAGAKVRLEQTRIVARQAGVILSRSVEPGDVVQPAQTLLVMAADAGTELVIAPDERNLAWIALGQRARAAADAYPQRLFDAEVNYIAPAVDPQRGSVEVRLSVPSAPDFLKPDMTVSVDLTVSSKKQVLTLPSDAVRGAGTPAPWVLIADGGRVAKRSVQLGIRGQGRLEIAAGIDEHAEVLLAEGGGVVPGQRVRPEPTEGEP